MPLEEFVPLIHIVKFIDIELFVAVFDVSSFIWNVANSLLHIHKVNVADSLCGRAETNTTL